MTRYDIRLRPRTWHDTRSFGNRVPSFRRGPRYQLREAMRHVNAINNRRGQNASRRRTTFYPGLTRAPFAQRYATNRHNRGRG